MAAQALSPRSELLSEDEEDEEDLTPRLGRPRRRGGFLEFLRRHSRTWSADDDSASCSGGSSPLEPRVITTMKPAGKLFLLNDGQLVLSSKPRHGGFADAPAVHAVLASRFKWRHGRSSALQHMPGVTEAAEAAPSLPTPFPPPSSATTPAATLFAASTTPSVWEASLLELSAAPPLHRKASFATRAAAALPFSSLQRGAYCPQPREINARSPQFEPV
ncbi:hypothetical protein T484DRAFT_1853527 [Baffinella frigidus]|nr:hypothetical protein T484DRAFT_1853527 [Cryptophyta sp. CCMP2293]